MYDNAKNKFESQKKQTTKRLENLGKVKVNAWAEGMDTFVTAFGTFKNVEMDRRIDTNMEFIGSDEEPKQMLMNIQNASMTANEVAKAGFAALGTGALGWYRFLRRSNDVWNSINRNSYCSPFWCSKN